MEICEFDATLVIKRDNSRGEATFQHAKTSGTVVHPDTSCPIKKHKIRHVIVEVHQNKTYRTWEKGREALQVFVAETAPIALWRHVFLSSPAILNQHCERVPRILSQRAFRFAMQACLHKRYKLPEHGGNHLAFTVQHVLPLAL